MADPTGLTIDQLRELSALESHLFLALDAPNETFKVALQTVVEYARSTINVTPTGSILMWPGETVPNGYIECAGQSFDVGVYPVLGAAFPSGKLPDTRGMVLKHVAGGRSVLSFESDAIKSHAHTASFRGNKLPNHNHSNDGMSHREISNGWERTTGHSDYYTSASNGSASAGTPSGSVTVNSTGGSENLVKNVGVKFIVKQE